MIVVDLDKNWKFVIAANELFIPRIEFINLRGAVHKIPELHSYNSYGSSIGTN